MSTTLIEKPEAKASVAAAPRDERRREQPPAASRIHAVVTEPKAAQAASVSYSSCLDLAADFLARG